MYGVLESCLFALVCIQIELQRNFKLYCLYFFFSKFELPNRGCGLSTGAAYTRNFTVNFCSKARTDNEPHPHHESGIQPHSQGLSSGDRKRRDSGHEVNWDSNLGHTDRRQALPLHQPPLQTPLKYYSVYRNCRHIEILFTRTANMVIN